MLEPIAGPLLKAFGTTLAFFYQFIPSYGVAIILVTILVRIVLIPLTLKQMRSMQAMQSLQPKVKELQRKYKGNRQKLNQEMMKLYQEHQVNPLGGCLPLVLQIPVFIALFAVLRATEGAFAVPSEPVQMSAVSGEETVCRPNTDPSISGETPDAVICEEGTGEETAYDVQQWRTKNSRRPIAEAPRSLAVCRATASSEDESQVGGFLCESRLGPGHLPEDSDLFGAIVEDRADFLWMDLPCSPLQAASELGVRQCAGPGTASGVLPAIPYYLLVALMIGSTYYQQRQMQRASAGPVAQQQQLMMRIMPVFLGFISLQISAGVLVYWVTTNGWQIGQQYLMLRSRVSEPPSAGKATPKAPKAAPTKGGSAKGTQGDGSKVSRPGGGRDARGRKKRRKR